MLPLNDKVAMLQNGVVAEQLGKATIYGQLAGICDHVAITDGGTNNLSNFMIGPKTGKLAPIDIDTKNINVEETNKSPFCGVKGAGGALKDLAGFVKDASASPEALAVAISNMVKEQQSMVTAKTLRQNPLAMLTVPDGEEGLIKPSTAESRLLKETRIEGTAGYLDARQDLIGIEGGRRRHGKTECRLREAQEREGPRGIQGIEQSHRRD